MAPEELKTRGARPVTALFSVWILLILGVSANVHSSNNQAATTAAGRVEGVMESGIQVFRGVPYAAPPVGKLRWREPQPVKPWKGVRETKTFAPRCMQLPVFGDMNFRSDGMSEDCLYLNIWTPSADAAAGLPVMVYFYGGGFLAGDGSEPRYDGYSMARHGVVAVTVNYRLGVFGFLAHPELTAEAAYGASGNYGLLDQSAALGWVRENIRAFGGDPDRVTIAGESAGSASVSGQMMSPLSRGLFRGAIGESGSFLNALRAVPLAEAEKSGLEFALHSQAKSLSSLRAIEARKLLDLTLKSQTGGPFGMDLFAFPVTVDKHFFPQAPETIYTRGDVAQVPLLVGWNSQEMGHQFLFHDRPLTRESFDQILKDRFGDRTARAAELYSAGDDEELLQAATDLAGDLFLGHSTWKWADRHRQTGNRVYQYYYSRPRPAMRPEFAGARANLAGGITRQGKSDDCTPPQVAPPASGAVHSAEIEYALGNLPGNRVYDWQAEDFRVSGTMQAYFANFIKNGDPNGPGLPQWPTMNSGAPRPIMQLDVDSRAIADRFRERHLFLESMESGSNGT